MAVVFCNFLTSFSQLHNSLRVELVRFFIEKLLKVISAIFQRSECLIIKEVLQDSK